MGLWIAESRMMSETAWKTTVPPVAVAVNRKRLATARTSFVIP